jgi:tetratricopeptide (TPR) repeat protein
MLLAPIVLAAAFLPVPQEAPPPVAPSPQNPPSAVKAADLPATSASPAQPHLDAGLAAFKKRRFAQAETAFRKAMEADPQSAAAAFYLGYTYYKLAEPKRHDSPGKQKALDLFSKAYALDPEFKPVWQSKK